MARRRMISASLGQSRKFARLRAQDERLGLFAQALYPLLVVNSDDFGRQEGDAFTVKHRILPTAQEEEATFDAALDLLHEVGLIVRYKADGRTVLQVVDFFRHQQGLHKRTRSRFPEFPGEAGNRRESSDASPNVREVPPEENRTEENTTERNGPGSRKPDGEAGVRRPAPSSSSPKRPRFTGTRLTVFPWQHEKLGRVLGKHAANFDLDRWYHDLDAEVVTSDFVIPSRDGAAWLEAELLKAVRARGLSIAKADRVEGGRTGAAPQGKYSKVTRGVS